MNEQQALAIIKQFLDNALKIGVCSNLEGASALTQAFKVINDRINKSE